MGGDPVDVLLGRREDLLGQSEIGELPALRCEDLERFAAAAADRAELERLGARAVGEPCPAPPLYVPSVLDWGGPPAGSSPDGLAWWDAPYGDELALEAVHGGQRLDFAGVPRAGDVLTRQRRFTGLEDKRGRTGRFLRLTKTSLFARSGEVVLRVREDILLRSAPDAPTRRPDDGGGLRAGDRTAPSGGAPADSRPRGGGPQARVAPPDDGSAVRSAGGGVARPVDAGDRAVPVSQGRVEVRDRLPELRVTPSRLQGVRFSQATGNTHLIHLDTEVARSQGFDGPVVQSSLHGAQLLAVVTSWLADQGADAGAVERFEWRNLAPAVFGTTFVCAGELVAATPDVVELALSERSPEGTVHAAGRAIVRQTPRRLR